MQLFFAEPATGRYVSFRRTRPNGGDKPWVMHFREIDLGFGNNTGVDAPSDGRREAYQTEVIAKIYNNDIASFAKNSRTLL